MLKQRCVGKLFVYFIPYFVIFSAHDTGRREVGKYPNLSRSATPEATHIQSLYSRDPVPFLLWRIKFLLKLFKNPKHYAQHVYYPQFLWFRLLKIPIFWLKQDSFFENPYQLKLKVNIWPKLNMRNSGYPTLLNLELFRRLIALYLH